MRFFLTLALACTSVAACEPPRSTNPAEAAIIELDIKPDCPTGEVFVGWNDPTSCDVNPPQTLSLRDELSDLDSTVDQLQDRCDQHGGTFTLYSHSPVMALCTAVDY